MPDLTLYAETASAWPNLAGAAFVLAIVAGGLVLLSIGVVIQVMLASRNKKFSIRAMFSGLMSVIWTIPVLATVGFFAYRVAATVDLSDADDAPRQVQHADEKSSESVSFSPVEEPPAWTKNEAVRDKKSGKITTIVISARGASVEEAERKLALQTRRLYEKEYPAETASQQMTNRLFRLSPERIARYTQGREPARIKGIETVFVAAPGDERKYSNEVWDVYWQLDFSPEKREMVRHATVQPRLWMLGGGVGLLALIVTAVAIYLRLDQSTQGRYRFRLKLATTTLIVAIGLLMTVALPIA